MSEVHVNLKIQPLTALQPPVVQLVHGREEIRRHSLRRLREMLWRIQTGKEMRVSRCPLIGEEPAKSGDKHVGTLDLRQMAAVRYHDDLRVLEPGRCCRGMVARNDHVVRSPDEEGGHRQAIELVQDHLPLADKIELSPKTSHHAIEVTGGLRQEIVLCQPLGWSGEGLREGK